MAEGDTLANLARVRMLRMWIQAARPDNTNCLVITAFRFNGKTYRVEGRGDTHDQAMAELNRKIGKLLDEIEYPAELPF